jgi:acyl-CoA synthetase (AMP-forming)/AMP-acid ligase II
MSTRHGPDRCRRPTRRCVQRVAMPCCWVYWDVCGCDTRGYRRRRLDAQRRPRRRGRRWVTATSSVSLKDMLIPAARNVFPREIEEYLYRHPKVPGSAGVRHSRHPPRREICGLDRAQAKAPAHTEDEIPRNFCRGQNSRTTKVRRVTSRFVAEFTQDRDRQAAENVGECRERS